MPSETDLLNRALSLIGEQRIISIDDLNPRAQAFRDSYAEIRRALLSSHAWGFATGRLTLAPDGTAPSFGWTYRFRKPAETATLGEWLRTISVSDNADETGRLTYTEEGEFLLADVDTLYVRYIGDVSDPNRMIVEFRQALAYKLAADLAITLTNSNQLSDRLDALARRWIAEAKAVDSMGRSPPDEPMGDWESARVSGGL